MRPREIVVMTVAAGLLSWQLLAPGFIGMANNGDFGKIAGRLCIAGADHDTDNFVFFESDYIRDAKNCYEANIASSEHWFAGIASSAERGLSNPRRFDIRWLGAVHAIGWLMAYALLLISVRPLAGSRWWSAAAASLLIFFDVAYVAYFNTFYTDAAALIGAFAMVAVFPAMLERPMWIPVFAGGGVLYVTSKAQHALLFIIISFVLLWIAVNRCITGAAVRRSATAFAAFAVVAAGALWAIRSSPDWSTVQPRFNLIFYKLLPRSATRARDAAELGLNSADLKYIGTHSFLPGTPTIDPDWVRGFRARSGSAALIRFYLRHPSVAFRFVRDDLKNEAGQIRAMNLSNFRRQDGHPPGAHTSRMSAWSAFRSWLFMVWPTHILLIYTLTVIAGVWTRNWVVLFAGALGAGEFAIASLGDALETNRHLLLFHFFTDSMIFFAAARPVRTQSGKPMPS